MKVANIKVRIKGTNVYVPQTAAMKASAGAYEGASQAPRLSRWITGNRGPNESITGSLDTLRARSRDMVRRNGLADGAVEKLVDNIIGTGIVPQFRTKNSAFNDELSELWLRWTDEADTFGDYDFYGLQALATRSMLEAGEVFTRLRPRRAGDVRTVPLQLQMLESEFCPVEKNETIGQSIILSGIELDAIDHKVAYWLYRQHPNDTMVRVVGMGDTVRVPASEIAHMKMVRRPGMMRGEPWLTRSLIKLHDLDKYDDAQLIRQQISAMFVAFMSPNADGQLAYESEGTEDDEVQLSSLEPGTAQVLPPGAQMNFATPPSPGDSYAVFNKQQHQYIASSLGILYEQLTGDYSAGNDRTWRAAFNEFKRKIRRHQHHMVVFQWCRPIMQRWVDLGIISGQIRIPAGITAAQIAMCDWVPQAFDYINPVQDIEAQTKEIRAGLASRRQKINERGDNIEKIDADNAADNARADSNDLIYDTNAKHVSQAGVTQARPGGTGFAAPDTEPEMPQQPQPGADAIAFARAAELNAQANLTRAEAERQRAMMPPAPINVDARTEVHTPEIRNEYTAPPVNVNVEAAPAPTMESPIVNVHLPSASNMREDIQVTSYDEKGRIKTMTKEITGG